MSGKFEGLNTCVCISMAGLPWLNSNRYRKNRMSVDFCLNRLIPTNKSAAIGNKFDVLNMKFYYNSVQIYIFYGFLLMKLGFFIYQIA